MIHPALNATSRVVQPSHQRRRLLGDAAAPRRRALLVAHHPQLVPLARQPEHGANKVCPPRTVHPRRAQDDMPPPRGRHPLLSHELGPTVHAQGRRRVVLEVRLSLRTVEH